MTNEEQDIGGAIVDRETDWRTLRALDAEIAERVMGWTRHSDRMHPTDNRTINGVLYCPPDYPNTSLGGFNCVPHYSGDIKAAMEVVGKMRSYGWNAHASTIAVKGWYCEFIKVSGNTAEFHKEESDSLPEAICLAALALVNKPDTNSANSNRPAHGQASETNHQDQLK
jgi:hypothetical protein